MGRGSNGGGAAGKNIDRLKDVDLRPKVIALRNFVTRGVGCAQVLFMSDQQLSAMHHRAMTNPAPAGAWGEYSSPARTSVLVNHLGLPCNCAAASPDGQWVAAVGDTPTLLLLHISEGYNEKKHKSGLKKQGTRKGSVLKFGAKQPKRTSRSNPRRADTSAGQQPWTHSFCCWNASLRAFVSGVMLQPSMVCRVLASLWLPWSKQAAA